MLSAIERRKDFRYERHAGSLTRDGGHLEGARMDRRRGADRRVLPRRACRYARSPPREAAPVTYRRGRRIFGRGLRISLEVLVAADLIRTVAVQPTLWNVGVLGAIVIVRTLLGFALDVEIDGVLPWRKRATRCDRRRAVRA